MRSWSLLSCWITSALSAYLCQHTDTHVNTHKTRRPAPQAAVTWWSQRKSAKMGRTLQESHNLPSECAMTLKGRVARRTNGQQLTLFVAIITINVMMKFSLSRYHFRPGFDFSPAWARYNSLFSKLWNGLLFWHVADPYSSQGLFRCISDPR